MRRRVATVFVSAATFVSALSNLAACGQTAKEDPVEEQNRQREVQPPEPSQPTEVEQTDRSIGKNIEG